MKYPIALLTITRLLSSSCEPSTFQPNNSRNSSDEGAAFSIPSLNKRIIRGQSKMEDNAVANEQFQCYVYHSNSIAAKPFVPNGAINWRRMKKARCGNQSCVSVYEPATNESHLSCAEAMFSPVICGERIEAEKCDTEWIDGLEFFICCCSTSLCNTDYSRDNYQQFHAASAANNANVATLLLMPCAARIVVMLLWKYTRGSLHPFT